MSRSQSQAENLEAILSETTEDAGNRRRRKLDEALPDLNNIALFGAGNTGQEVLRRLRGAGIEPVAFIDDTPAKQGSIVNGLRVYSRQQAADTLGDKVTALVTILNPNLTFVDAQVLLSEVGLKSESFMLLNWLFPSEFAGMCNVALPEPLLHEKASILECDTLWADDISRDTFQCQIAWRMSLDFARLPDPRLNDIYFPRDIDLDLEPDIAFIDAGAHDGDTLAQFLTHTDGRFGQALCIEPDPKNHAKLEQSIKDLGVGDRVTALNCGLSDKTGILSFNPTGDMSAAFGEGGSITMPVKKLADVMPPSCPLYAKFEIEGAEWDAIKGSADHIKQREPKLAVSVYHMPEDLWRLPLLMAKLLPKRRIYLRAHGVDGTDIICYSI